ITVSLLIICSTFAVGTTNSLNESEISYNTQNLETCTSDVDNINIQPTTNLQDPLGEVTKTIWEDSTSSWVDTIQADIDDVLTFNITIKYIPLYWESWFLLNMSVTDMLPPCLEYELDSGMVIWGLVEIPGQSGISTSENKIFWNLSEGDYESYYITLYNTSKTGCEDKEDSLTILFNATVIDYTDIDGEDNHVDVVGWETCPSHYVYGDADATVIVRPAEPNVTIEKYVKWACEGDFQKQTIAGINDWVTFELLVNNTGNIPIDISVRDELPSGLSYIPDSSTVDGITVVDEEPEVSGNFLYWNFTDVPADTHIIITFRAEVDECGTLINIANVTGEGDSQNTVYDEDDATVNVECEELYDLTIEKYVKWACEGDFQKQTTAEINDWVTFKLLVNNTGNIPIDISVRDELPSGLSYIPDSSTVDGITVVDEEPEVSGNFLYWNFTDVPSDTHIIITFRAEIDECGTLINIANVTGEDDSQNTVYDEDDATVNVECPTPELVIDKKVWNETSSQWEENITAFVGETVRFNITISYYGPNILYNIYINDTLPSGLEYANNANPPESWISGNNIYWNLTEDYDIHLNGGESYYIEFDATVISSGEHINIVNITANECSGIIMYGEDDAIVYVTTGEGLICDKYVKDRDGSWVKEISANVGDTVRFNITLTYIGSVFIYSIWVNDTLPDCLEYDNYATPMEPTINGNKLLWHFQSDYLDPGESIYIEFDAIVIDEGVGVNLVNIRACECFECDEIICSDSATVNCFAELNAEASGTPTEILEGETVTFTGGAAGGDQPYSWSWDFDDGTTDSSLQNPTHQFNSAGQYLVTLTVTDDNDDTDTANVQITVNENEENTKPNKPSKPTGETEGKADTEYIYSTSATDPDNDQLLYLWDWGDGTNSGWLGPYNSGATITASNSWSNENTYEIKVMVKDPDGLQSDWSDPLSVTMPYNKFIPNFIINILNMLKEKFPFMEKIISNIFYST
ncbi:PKD domain-containing protein, partial [Thermoplasmatota archaeon]